MGQTRQPRMGSMQVWPRKRADRETAYVRHWAKSNDPKPLGFAGYKVGMTHCIFQDNKSSSVTKGMDLSCPVTIIECPPLKTVSIRFYKKNINNHQNDLQVLTEVMASQLDKDLKRKISLPKNVKKKIEDIKPEDYDDLRLLVYTQPRLTGFGKKRPEVFELALGGNKEQKLAYAKEKLGKEIGLREVFKEGQQLDIHSVTKGKGFQGPVKRFGVSIRRHKSEKAIRNPGSLGAWCAQRHFMYRIAHAGQMGYHQRVSYNTWLLKIGDKPEDINSNSGYNQYGVVKNQYILVKGSIGGARKRLIRFNTATRPNKHIPSEAPVITYTNVIK